MFRLIVLFGFVLLCGCSPSDRTDPQKPANTEIAESTVDTAPLASAFRLDETRQVVLLDTQVAPPQRRRFDIGQGSITLEMLHVANDQLTFRYTPEVEGGYTIYECTLPVSLTPVEFHIAADGTPGPTSFDLKACTVIRQGNVHFDELATEKP